MIQPKVCARGNDRGTQYRSGIYTYGAEQAQAAKASLTVFAEQLRASGFGAITSEIFACAPVLLCRRLSSAIFGEKSQWLLRHRRNWG